MQWLQGLQTLACVEFQDPRGTPAQLLLGEGRSRPKTSGAHTACPLPSTLVGCPAWFLEVLLMPYANTTEAFYRQSRGA